TAAVLRALVGDGARSAWRTVALAVDAGLEDAAWALGRLVDGAACVELGRITHSAWNAFVRLAGYYPESNEAPEGELVALAAACRALAEIGALVPPAIMPSDDDDFGVDDEHDSDHVTDAARSAIAAAADVIRRLAIELDDDTRPLLEPQPTDTRDQIDTALDVIGVQVRERLAPYLVGTLDRDIAASWRAELAEHATAPRELFEVPAEPEEPVPAWMLVRELPPSEAPTNTDVSGGLSRLDGIERSVTPAPAP